MTHIAEIAAREKAATVRIEELRKRPAACPACGVSVAMQQRTRCPECRGPFVWPVYTEEDAAYLLAQLRDRDEKLAAVEEALEVAEVAEVAEERWCQTRQEAKRQEMFRLYEKATELRRAALAVLKGA